MFINNTQTPIRQFKTKVNLTINPKIYEQFKQVAEKNLQPKSWVIERMMKSYTLETICFEFDEEGTWPYKVLLRTHARNYWIESSSNFELRRGLPN